MFFRLIVVALLVVGGIWLLRRLLPATVQQGGQPRSQQGGRISEAEALRILGLSPEASRDDVLEAHRRLIQKLHPDRGGSDYLAQRINDARDSLLESR